MSLNFYASDLSVSNVPRDEHAVIVDRRDLEAHGTRFVGVDPLAVAELRLAGPDCAADPSLATGKVSLDAPAVAIVGAVSRRGDHDHGQRELEGAGIAAGPLRADHAALVGVAAAGPDRRHEVACGAAASERACEGRPAIVLEGAEPRVAVQAGARAVGERDVVAAVDEDVAARAIARRAECEDGVGQRRVAQDPPADPLRAAGAPARTPVR